MEWTVLSPVEAEEVIFCQVGSQVDIKLGGKECYRICGMTDKLLVLARSQTIVAV